MQVNDFLAIPDSELELTYARASGPGGQNVNKVNSKAVLRWNFAASTALPEAARARFAALFGSRLTKEGIFVIASDRFRDQSMNRSDCFGKLREMVLAALVEPKKRRPTKPTRGSRERRHAEKKSRSAIKKGRTGRYED